MFSSLKSSGTLLGTLPLNPSDDVDDCLKNHRVPFIRKQVLKGSQIDQNVKKYFLH